MSQKNCSQYKQCLSCYRRQRWHQIGMPRKKKQSTFTSASATYWESSEGKKNRKTTRKQLTSLSFSSSAAKFSLKKMLFSAMTMTKEYQKKKEQRNTFLEVYVVIGVRSAKRRNEIVFNNVSIKMQKKDKNPPWNSLRRRRCRFWQPKKS